METPRRRDKRPAVEEINTRPSVRSRDGASTSATPSLQLALPHVSSVAASSSGVGNVISNPTVPGSSTQDVGSGSRSEVGWPSRASWMQPEFQMPTSLEELKKLGAEITTTAVPLSNLDFSDKAAAACIGLPAVKRATDLRLHNDIREMDPAESSNLAGALLTQASSNFPCTSSFCEAIYSYPSFH